MVGHFSSEHIDRGVWVSPQEIDTTVGVTTTPLLCKAREIRR